MMSKHAGFRIGSTVVTQLVHTNTNGMRASVRVCACAVMPHDVTGSMNHVCVYGCECVLLGISVVKMAVGRLSITCWNVSMVDVVNF